MNKMQGKAKTAGRPRRDEDYDKPEDIPLNLTELQFVSHFSNGESLAECARLIGSDAKDLSGAGRKIAHRPNVKRAISEHEREYIVQSAVSKTEVVLMFRKTFEAALQKGDIKAANEAAKFLGQSCPDMFHSPQKKESDEEKGNNARLLSDNKAIDTFSMGEEDYDVNSDLNKYMTVTKSSTLGMDEFDVPEPIVKVTKD